MNKIVGLLGLCCAVLTSSCTVGPRYKRPDVVAPPTYRGDVNQQAAAGSPGQGAPPAVMFGDEKWWEVFQDSQLQELLRTALKQNYNVRIAAARVLQAQAQLGIIRADQFPTISGNASVTSQRTPQTLTFPPLESTSLQLGGALSWELDFWGKFRRATEAARAQLLASEWGQRAVMSTLVASVASAYFQLRELDLELDISKRTLQARDESLRLTKIKEQGGVTSMVDVRQAEQLVYNAASTITDLQRRIEQQENLISTLLGENPRPVKRGAGLNDQPHAPQIPPGLPSSLLQRRPDIVQSEQQLIAANARIGVARANYFPQITLTGNAGTQSTALSELFSGPSGFWNVTGGLVQPIFTGGRIKSTVRFSEAQKLEAVLAYQNTIQQSFREVSDALVGYRRNQEFAEEQRKLVVAAQDAMRLSTVRYEGGVTSYLEVLDSDTRYFTAALEFSQAKLAELLSYVELYRALGGGWQQQ